MRYIGSLWPEEGQLPKEYSRLARMFNLPPSIEAEGMKKVRGSGALFLDCRSECLNYNQYACKKDINELITPVFREKLQRGYVDSGRHGQELSISVHIRRGDVHPGMQPERYLYNSYYMEVLKCITSKIPGSYKITILSDGPSNVPSGVAAVEPHETLDIFASSFPADKIELKVDESLEASWRCMVESDILVISRSSFSYSPAVLCKGIVIYHPFWCGQISGWLNSKDDDFEDQLESRLSLLTTT